MFEKLIPYDAAHIILTAYTSYHHQFKRITKRAKIRFENRDWHGMQQDGQERSELYRKTIAEATSNILEFLGENANNREVWMAVKQMYFEEISNFNTRNIAETFYNSIFRHSHKGLSADPELMFVHGTGSYREFKSTFPIFHLFDFTTSIQSTIERVVSFYHFDVPFQDIARDIRYLCNTLEEKLSSLKVDWKYLKLEVLKSIFFRNKAAYIVGRLYVHDSPMPFVIPLLHVKSGIFFDALLLDYNDVSSIFSYNRSYFLVDVDIISEMIDFLESILPTKSRGELYNSIGFEKHGKTVFYRDFVRHLFRSDDKFVNAPGIKGMVMSVFTLPSYNMVFKLIKDKFEPPKNVTEEEVKQKYRLVNQHDRVGRMTDSHMFENLVFDRRRFSKDLLEELLHDAPSKIEVTDSTVKIKHLYVEKRMIPLNIFLQEAPPDKVHDAINDYGKAIKELAAVNIFPGDMLLKNFGVTRLNRIVFYDYDEIGFLTDYNFRRFPEPRDEYEELASEPYYHVGHNDIFPEEFRRFLIGDRDIREIFFKLHGDLFDIVFWRNMQKRLNSGEIVDVFPYRDNLRFVNKYKDQTEALLKESH